MNPEERDALLPTQPLSHQAVRRLSDSLKAKKVSIQFVFSIERETVCECKEDRQSAAAIEG